MHNRNTVAAILTVHYSLLRWTILLCDQNWALLDATAALIRMIFTQFMSIETQLLSFGLSIN